MNIRRFLAAAALASALAMPQLSAAEEPGAPGGQEGAERLERLEREMQELRRENAEFKRRLDTVELEGEETKHSLGILSRFVDVGGYADAEFRATGNDNENSGFRVRHLSLFFTKDIQKEWKLFTEIEYEDAPLIESTHTSDAAQTVQGKLFVEQMYIEYHPGVAWDVRAGRFLTPAGIWNIYHYPPYVPTQERPLMVRKIFPQVSDGVQVRNSLPVGGAVLDTHLYAANGSGNPGRLDRNEDKGFGARANLDLHGVWFGGSYYREEDNSGTLKNSYGVHLLVDRSPFKFQSEYQVRTNDPDAAASFEDRGFYAQLAWDIGKWTLAARYDWYDPLSYQPDADLFRYTGAVNYHFAHNVVGKAEYNRNVFEDATEDYDEVVLAIVVAIGDL